MRNEKWKKNFQLLSIIRLKIHLAKDLNIYFEKIDRQTSPANLGAGALRHEIVRICMQTETLLARGCYIIIN